MPKILWKSFLLFCLFQKLYFKTPATSNPSFHTRTVSIDHNYKAIYKASCWDYYDFYIGKTKQRLHDRKTEHFKAFWKGDHSSAITDHVKTTGHGVILRFCCPANLTTIVKLRRPCLFRSCSQHLMSMSAVKSFYFIRKAFPLSHFTDSFCLKRLKFLLQMFSV